MNENELVVEQVEPVETGAIEKDGGNTEEKPVQELAVVKQEQGAISNILDNADGFLATMKMAKALSQANILPRTFSGQPGNCLILIDMVKRSGMSLLFVAQNLYIVSGNPSWSGQACIALINNCGRFTNLRFRETYKSDTDWSCTAYATDKNTGEMVESTTITYKLAKDSGWVDKNGSFWKKMPMQMARYRAAAFFARTYCPEALFGLYTDSEQKDIHGWEDKPEMKTYKLEERT